MVFGSSHLSLTYKGWYEQKDHIMLLQPLQEQKLDIGLGSFKSKIFSFFSLNKLKIFRCIAAFAEKFSPFSPTKLKIFRYFHPITQQIFCHFHQQSLNSFHIFSGHAVVYSPFSPNKLTIKRIYWKKSNFHKFLQILKEQMMKI